MKTRSIFRQLLLFAIVIAFLALAVATVWSSLRESTRGCQWTHPGDDAAIETAARPVIDALEQYRKLHGEYPTALSSAGMSDSSPHGSWRYTLMNANGQYRLALGEYGKCWWESTYNSKDRSWYHDC